MPCGSAAYYNYFLYFIQLSFIQGNFLCEVYFAPFSAAHYGFLYRARLLVDFFQHEVREARLFGSFSAPLDFLDFLLNFLPVEVENFYRIRC